MGTEFKFFEIDEHRLDSEWVRQPAVYYRYAVKLADARTAYEQAKAARDVTVAELDREIRTHPEVYGVAKITEGVVEKTVLLQPEYQKAIAEVIDAKHQMDMLQAAVDTLEHRKRALENLVSLHGQNYFSTPRAPHGTEEEMDEAVKRHTRKKGKRATNDS